MAEVLDITYDEVEALDHIYYKGSNQGNNGSYLWQGGGNRLNLLKKVQLVEALDHTFDKVKALDPAY